MRIAVEQALVYDSAATACFPGFFASRINYDVVQGNDAEGHWHSGVLEQSWRAGGATGAEIAALEAFKADPACRVVRASCIEIYGPSDEPPPGAVVYFRGIVTDASTNADTCRCPRCPYRRSAVPARVRVALATHVPSLPGLASSPSRMLS